MSDNNPTMDRAIHNGADVSIGTQSEEEECRGIGFKKHLNSLMLKIQRNYDFQTKDQKQTL
jgi:hypothetical protein